ncbi:hypothetical protein JRO89_XS04G0268900 [Xanthoceras sorbifolium]|uniref:FPL domain-containing protein n=1 Tax=Xanthoceras sorbifolium TaxID=99658 RepID=A0ABQ8I7D6_9ROSI|nr:hypothetical protein JRO89_XS04G0268900 [Xanthoceras sorbifolium]
MWFSFWKSRDRFSLEELRYLTEQLQKVQIVNEFNKDFVIEALRSIAELLTYGDQHDSSFFEFFMEKQVMVDFVRILKVSRTITVSLQLLQTMSIMIQNLKSEHAIYYMFSNEHINYLITYSFDFRNEELLSYYISFLRAISGKLNKNTISLLLKTQNEEIVSFPLYSEAIRFAFHEESMVRIAVRALTLNVYHVGDDSVNRFITSDPYAEYFTNLVSFFRKQCIDLDRLVSLTHKNPSPDSTSTILAAVDEIEDNLYYFSDIVSAGIPDVGRLITDHILQLLILPLLLPSLQIDTGNETEIGAVTCLYLLCCILRIVKIKDLSNTITAALFCPIEAYISNFEAKLNGYMPGHDFTYDYKQSDDGNVSGVEDGPSDMAATSQIYPEDVIAQNNCRISHFALREALLSYVTSGDDVHASGSLSVLATLLQTKELDESMLDALGILPQRKQHKKLLLQALVGEGSGEEQLFSSESTTVRDGSELDGYLRKLKEKYGVLCSLPEEVMSPLLHRNQVLDALVSLFCRSNISAETLWDGGWLLRQLLPYSETEFNSHHLKLLKDSYKNCTNALLEEIRGIWADLIISVLCDEWQKCKRVIEASSPRRDPKCLLLPLHNSSSDDILHGESSFIAGEKMCELVKSRDFIVKSLWSLPYAVDAVPCRIAFERGKERHFRFLAISVGTSGWLVLAEELPLKQQWGIIRVVAPLAGSNPKIDEKHSRWLHLRIRPSTLPLTESAKATAYGKLKAKALVDGRWTLAFRDEESCKSAFSMIVEEINLQSGEVERRLRPLLDLERALDSFSTPS